MEINFSAGHFFCSEIGIFCRRGTLRSSKGKGGSPMTVEEMKNIDVRTVSRDDLVDIRDM